jgi:hypothetical protein
MMHNRSSLCVNIQPSTGMIRPQKERFDVTVGIAAACIAETPSGEFPCVICASDRMITAGDVQFQPDQAKTYPLTRSIIMLISGDGASQMEALPLIKSAVTKRLEHDDTWIGIREMAVMASGEIVGMFKERVDRTVLAPHGLTRAQFLTSQAQMRPEFYRGLIEQMNGCYPQMRSLIAGVDSTGAHIYEVDGYGNITCHDGAGFAAIGSGQRHAEAQFMAAGHASNKPYAETLLLTYAAKKRSEVAPGVGPHTDVAIVGGLGNFSWLTDQSYVHAKYEKLAADMDNAFQAASKDIAAEYKATIDKIKATIEKTPDDQSSEVADLPKEPEKLTE